MKLENPIRYDGLEGATRPAEPTLFDVVEESPKIEPMEAQPTPSMEIQVEAETEKVYPQIFYPKISEIPVNPTEWIIKDLFIKGQNLTGVVGPSNCGKTFFVLDVLLAYVTGEKEWNGRKIYAGEEDRKVVYLCSEGTDKILHRIYGYLQEHGKAIEDIDGKFILLDFKRYSNEVKEIYLRNPDTLKTIRDCIRLLCGNSVGMIAVDTYNGFYGGKENDSDEAAQMFANVETYLSAEFDANVIFIHHTGVAAIGAKIEEMRPRGSSSFISKLDICIMLNGNITYGTEGFISKARDSEKGIRFYLLARKVVVKTIRPNSEGQPTTTLVIQWNISGSEIRKSMEESEAKKDTPTPLVYSDFEKLQKAMADGTLPFTHLDNKDYQEGDYRHYVYEIAAKDLKEYIRQNVVLPKYEDEDQEDKTIKKKISKELSAEYLPYITERGGEVTSPKFTGRLVKYGLLEPNDPRKPTKWTTRDRTDYGSQFCWYAWTFKPREDKEIPQ